MTDTSAVSATVELHRIDISATNPRKHFDPKKLGELTESISTHGVLQPILLRPRGERFELVAGERRFRAATAAGLAAIPAVVRDLDDKQALEVQVIENLQRDDLHPLEEANGYALLVKSHGYDVDELATKIAKSRSYVYARLKLTELCAAAKKALAADEISHSIALLIARIPDEKLQAEATRQIIGNGPNTFRREPMSFRDASEYVHREFMLRLSEAPFDRKDATLVPAAGPCGSCAFRTGNQKDLFGDVKSADVCTKPPCFTSKLDAHWLRLEKSAKEMGFRILPKSEGKAVFGDYGNALYNNAPYVDVNDSIDYGSKKTFGKVLAGKVQITMARHPRTGAIYELIARKDAAAALKAAGVASRLTSSAVGGSNDEYRNRQKREAEQRKLERAIEATIIAELQPKLPELQLSLDLVRILGKSIALSQTYRMEDVFKRRGLKWPGYNEREKAIVKFIDGLTAGEIVLIAAELQLNFNNLEARGREEKNLVRQLAALVGVDAPAIDKRLRAEAAEKKKKAKVAKAKKKAKVARKTPAAAPATKATPKAAQSKSKKKKTAAAAPAKDVATVLSELVCAGCGCTEAKACQTESGPCAWVDTIVPLCSACDGENA